MGRGVETLPIPADKGGDPLIGTALKNLWVGICGCLSGENLSEAKENAEKDQA